MHPEIEKLIDLALADGEVTENEREIIFRKAEKLGLDQDEIEMILEGKINQLKTKKSQQNQNTKQGVIKKCPHCGAPAKSFADKCEACGEDFRFDTLNNLTSNLSGVEENDVRQISLINIPINKEELIQFATYSFGNAKNNALGLPERNAWYAKFNEAKNKLKLSYQIEFNPFKSDANIAIIGGLMDKAQQLQLENELSGQDLKDAERLEKLNQETKDEWKKPTTWVGIIFAILVTYGMYKIVMMLLK
jgi:hypothetical protein